MISVLVLLTGIHLPMSLPTPNHVMNNQEKQMEECIFGPIDKARCGGLWTTTFKQGHYSTLVLEPAK